MDAGIEPKDASKPRDSFGQPSKTTFSTVRAILTRPKFLVPLVIIFVLFSVVIAQNAAYLSGHYVNVRLPGRPAHKVASESEMRTELLWLLPEDQPVAFRSDRIEFSVELAQTNVRSYAENTNLSPSYSMLRNLLPFGPIVFAEQIEPYDDWDLFSKYAGESLSEIAQNNSKQPIDAQMIIIGGSIGISTDKPGSLVQSESIINGLWASLSRGSFDVEIQDEITEATVSKESLSEVKGSIEESLASQLVFELDGNQHIVSDAEGLRAVLKTSQTVQSLKPVYDSDKFGAWVNSVLAEHYGVAAVNEVRYSRGGKEVQTIAGSEGVRPYLRESIIDAAIDQVLNPQDPRIVLAVDSEEIKYQTSTVYLKTYDQAGLQQVLDEVGSKYGAAVAVHDLASGFSAQVNAKQQRTAASTYKLPLAYYIGKKVDSGDWSWSDGILDQTLESCLDIMLRISDNTCAQEIIYNIIGGQKYNSWLQGQGLMQTCVSCPYASTSASDQLKIISRIHGSDGISSASSQRIVDLLKKQIHRQGIPSGAGYIVANKPGWLFDYRNDTAIVYGPSGPILISILSEGHGWMAVSEIATAIVRQLNP